MDNPMSKVELGTRRDVHFARLLRHLMPHRFVNPQTLSATSERRMNGDLYKVSFKYEVNY